MQSGDIQPHTRKGQLVDLGPIRWAAIATGSAAVTVEVDVTTRRQTIHGFGGAFTEAASFVFANLSSAAKTRVLEEYWGAEGIGYTTGRVAMVSSTCIQAQ